MKIRNGFVSNSSSSSFVCDVCGDVESGWDAEPSDVGMVYCANGHIVCLNHINKQRLSEYFEGYDNDMIEELCNNSYPDSLLDTKIKEAIQNDPSLDEVKLRDIVNESSEYGINEEYNVRWVPKEVCPLCSLECLTDTTILNYILKNKSLDKEKIISEIKEKYDNLETLEKDIKP